MEAEKKCLRCGGARLEPGVLLSSGRVHFQAENTRVLTFLTSDIEVEASICLGCGFIELKGDFRKAESVTGDAKAA
jgi:hypothetical protein